MGDSGDSGGGDGEQSSQSGMREVLKKTRMGELKKRKRLNIYIRQFERVRWGYERD